MDAPDLLLVALFAVEVVAVGLAVRRRVTGPLVALLVFALVDEVAVEALHRFAFAGAPRPLAGWHRAGWHVETLFVLGWPAALAAVAHDRPLSSTAPCKITDAPRRALLAAYLGLAVGLVLGYPPARERYRAILLAWELVCVAVAWWGIGRAWGRTWGAAEKVLVVLVSCETMVCVVGPFASDPFLRWWIARCFYLGAWGAACGVLVRGSVGSSARRGGR